MTDTLTKAVILAALGGFIVNLLNLLELQRVPKERRPDFRDWLYWLPFLAWPVLGGVVGYLYDDAASPLGKLVAFHVGISSPLILRQMANALPTQPTPKLTTGA